MSHKDKLTLQKWCVMEWTISKFYNKAVDNLEIDTDPEGQRTDESEEDQRSLIGSNSKPSKAQGIINTIFKGNDIGEIKLTTNGCTFTVSEDGKDIILQKIPGSEYFEFVEESVDGGHRKRHMIWFKQNKFPTHKTCKIGGGKFWKDLTQEEKDFFDNYVCRFVIYENLTDDQRGSQFRDTNTVTPVNNMGHLNSFGKREIAKVVRRMTRAIKKVNNIPHQLFEYTYTNTDKNKKTYSYLDFNNSGLIMDEITARVFYRIYKGGGLGTCGFQDLLDMYEANPSEEEVTKMSEKAKKTLDFFLLCSTSKKRLRATKGSGLKLKEVAILHRLYCFFNDLFGEGQWSIIDIDEFYESFYKTYIAFTGNPPADALSKNVKEKDGKEDRTWAGAWKGYMGIHNSEWKIEESVLWFTSLFSDFTKHILVKDKKRVFTKQEIETRWVNNNFRSEVSGKRISLKQAVGGHGLAHALGGSTDAKTNLFVTSKEENTEMGMMHPNDYKKVINN